MLCVYGFYLKIDSEVMTQWVLLGTGVLGVLASNPFVLVLTPDGTRVSDHFLEAAFLAAYRMFLMIESELLRTRKSSIGMVLIAIIGIAFGVYLMIEASDSYDRAMQESDSRSEFPQTPGTVLFWAHALYIAASIVSYTLLWCAADTSHRRRFSFFTFCWLLSSTATFLTQLIPLSFDTLAPRMVYEAVHTTLAAVSLFLMHSTASPQYKDLISEPPSTVLDVEQMSEEINRHDGFQSDNP
jgi:hypothetical protein